jgi:hypothetical protein
MVITWLPEGGLFSFRVLPKTIELPDPNRPSSSNSDACNRIFEHPRQACFPRERRKGRTTEVSRPLQLLDDDGSEQRVHVAPPIRCFQAGTAVAMMMPLSSIMTSPRTGVLSWVKFARPRLLKDYPMTLA